MTLALRGVLLLALIPVGIVLLLPAVIAGAVWGLVENAFSFGKGFVALLRELLGEIGE